MGDFNPLRCILLLEAYLNIDKSQEPDVKVNYIIDLIEIVKQNESINDINDKIKLVTQRNDTKLKNDKINEKINEIIPKLKILCNTENMMQCFMDMIHLIDENLK